MVHNVPFPEIVASAGESVPACSDRALPGEEAHRGNYSIGELALGMER